MLVPDVSKRKLKRFSPEEEGPARWGLPLCTPGMGSCLEVEVL
jgi:hypothetical protein